MLSLLDHVHNSYDSGGQNNIDQKLNEEIQAGKSQKNVGNYLGSSRPGSQRFAEKQEHTANKQTGIENGRGQSGNQRRQIFSARLYLLTLTVNQSVKNRRNKARGNSLYKTDQKRTEGIGIPKNVSAGIQRGNAVDQNNQAKGKAKNGSSLFAK